jgi:hypothetical protein
VIQYWTEVATWSIRAEIRMLSGAAPLRRQIGGSVSTSIFLSTRDLRFEQLESPAFNVVRAQSFARPFGT